MDKLKATQSPSYLKLSERQACWYRTVIPATPGAVQEHHQLQANSSPAGKLSEALATKFSEGAGEQDVTQFIVFAQRVQGIDSIPSTKNKLSQTK